MANLHIIYFPQCSGVHSICVRSTYWDTSHYYCYLDFIIIFALHPLKQFCVIRLF